MIKLIIKDNMAGIYCYRDKTTGEVIYIGKDAKLKYHNRHLDHTRTDGANKKQHIDKVLQANHNQYIYEQVCFCDAIWLDVIEEMFIKFYKPKHNILLNNE